MVLPAASDKKLPFSKLPLLLEYAENEHNVLQKMVQAHVNKNFGKFHELF